MSEEEDENHEVTDYNFALNLIEAIKHNKGTDENIFVSPFSISMALAMTLVGGRQETAAQMKSVMKLDSIENDSAIHDMFKSTIDSLTAVESQTSGIKLHTANRIYVHDKTNLLSEFKDILQTKYDSTSVLVNFVKEYEKARLEINKWVEEKTANKIKDLLVPGFLNPATRLLLVNAVYFKGDWAKQFKPRKTSKRDFYVNESKKIKVNMMIQQHSFHFSWDRDLNCQILELFYKNENLSMFILLPIEKFGLKEFESKLTVENLNNLLNKTYVSLVKIYIPKLKIESSLALNDILIDMGIKDLFDPNKADLSGIDGTKSLCVSAVQHKAFIKVNEEGSEAAAATVSQVVLYSSRGEKRKPPKFLADHPFILLIRENSTKSILFWGRIVDPS